MVATKDQAGKIKLHQAVNLTATGAVSGSFWGPLIGLIFLNPLLGLAMGAAAGAVSGVLTDVGIDDKFMKDFGRHDATWQLGAFRFGPQGHAGQGAGGDPRAPAARSCKPRSRTTMRPNSRPL